MPATFRIHPAIGIARVGNSPSSFYLAPEQRGALPIECDENGIPTGQPVTQFKDRQGRIRRQAARFRVYVYDDHSPAGRELRIGDEIDIVVQKSGQLMTVRIDDVQWTAYVANKKSSWYEFLQLDGEHGYDPNHPLRNADVTNPEERQKLIIDPGPRTVTSQDGKQKASFAPSDAGSGTFPPELSPNSISTLGDLMCVEQDQTNRLLVLGGLGDSGSMKTGFGNPKIEDYANNDGWFDDTSDGSVRAALVCTPTKISGQPVSGMGQRNLPVDDPAWVIVGYPRYAPELTDVVTMDDVLFDLAVRNFAYAPYMYGIAPFDGTGYPGYADDPAAWRTAARWNFEYRPYFERDIWPILERPMVAGFVMDIDPVDGGNPHENEPRGNFFEDDLRVPPDQTPDPILREHRDGMRRFIYAALRKPGRENDLYPEPARTEKPLLFAMPLLCGDNPLSNTVPSKFLRLTDTMLFVLHQWAEGKFIDEKSEAIDPASLAPSEATALDRGVLGNLLGGSFCPGGEASWIMRNPAIYTGPYRLRQVLKPVPGALTQPAVVNTTNDANAPANLAAGLEPGDITKYSGVPWQADFNECTNQPIDVTFRDWNVLYPASTGDPVAQTQHLTYWWPAHRPVTVHTAAGDTVRWSKTDATNRGDLEMVTVWATQPFIVGADPTDITQGVTIVDVDSTP
jgi:hypothetical protein